MGTIKRDSKRLLGIPIPNSLQSRKNLGIIGVIFAVISICIGVLLQSAYAATATMVPTGDVTTGWTVPVGSSGTCAGGTHCDHVDEGTSSTDTDYISTGSSGGGGEIEEFSLNSPASIASATQVVVNVRLRSITLGSAADTVGIALRVNGTLQAVTTETMTTTITNYTATFNGTWSQADVDSMQIYLIRNVLGTGSGGSRDDDVAVYNAYATLTYTPNVQVGQVAYRWFGNETDDSGIFAAKNDYSVATDDPKDVAHADFNEDGVVDVVTANNAPNSATVLLGNSSGSFPTAVTYATGGSPNNVLTADFNSDGFEDFATVNSSGASISILIGNGDGTFDAKVDYTTATNPNGFVIVDLDSDSALDIVVGNAGSSSASVLMGNGDGTFDTKVDYGVYSNPQEMVTNDFNEDGDADIITFSYTTSANMTVLIGNGNGTFATGVNYSTDDYPYRAVSSDFNADGFADLALTYGTASDVVSVFIGNGDGTFDPKVDYSVDNARGITVADVNNDSVMDILTSNNIVSTISVVIGNGDGTFDPKVDYPSGSGGYSLSIADFQGDGVNDIVNVNPGSDTISVHLGVPAPTNALAAVSTPASGVGPGSLVRLDLGLGVTSGDLVAGYNYKLRYQVKSGSCSTTPSAYSDVTSSSPIQFHDNPFVTDGSKYGFSALSPKRSGVTAVNQRYEENNLFISSDDIPANQDGLWEFGLAIDDAAAPGTYCLIATTNTDTALNSYTSIPEITVANPTVTQANHKWFANADSLTPGSQLAAQDTAVSIAPETPLRLRQRLAVDTAELGPSNKQFKLQYAEKSGSCSASFGGSISYVNPPPATGSETKIAGTGTNVLGVGDTAWTNPGNVTADDGTDASVTGSSAVSNMLYAENYGFTIPSNATITGIVVSADRSGNGNESRVQLLKQAGLQSHNKSDGSAFNNTGGDWGSSSDLWNNTWTPAEINHPNFGVALAAAGSGVTLIYVDYVSITVHYAIYTSQTMMAGAGNNNNLSGQFPWTSTGNITADDNVRASASSGALTAESQRLTSSNHGFSIPSNATISGIKLTSELSYTGTVFGDSLITVTKNGVSESGYRHNYGSWTGTRSWGGTTDLWDVTWTPSEINSSSFGAVMAADMDLSTSVYVDYMSLSVYYSAPSADTIFYYDNASVTGETTISSSGNDPTNSGRTAVYQTYQETDPYTNTVAGIPSGQDGMWDFAISTDSSVAGKTYCFRTVESDGTPLDTYSQYPEITFTGGGGGGPTLEQQTRGGQSVIDGIKNFFSW